MSGTGPAPLPSLGRPGELLSSGVVTRLHGEVYARLPHGRLVLIGGAGAGKTGAMILLLLAALEWRSSLPDDERARVPVPVWLTLGGWNPVTDSLRAWSVAAMKRDYPALRARDYGTDAAGQLIGSRRVALFLDGLDEMPAEMRALALKRIDEEAKYVRVVITSRPEEYQLAIQTGSLESVAVIELRPVRPDAAAAYLLHGQTGPSRERWERFGAYLRSNPGSVAAAALNNPLTLSLARDAYVNRDPAELTDPARCPIPEAITEHLIEQFLVAAYPSELKRTHAIKRLAWIAWHMETSQDLPWWEIPGWVAAWQLRLARGLAAGFITWLLVTIAVAFTSARTLGPPDDLISGLDLGTAAGLGAGLIAGLVTRLKPRLKDVPADSAKVRGPLIAGIAFSLAVLFSLGYFTDGGLLTGLELLIIFIFLIPFLVGFPGLIVALARRKHRLRTRSPKRPKGPVIERPLVRAINASLVPSAVVGLLDSLEGGIFVGVEAAIWAWLIFGISIGVTFGFWSGRGFGLAGEPQSLTPRWPRWPWLALLPAFPVLIPVLLNSWATPIAESPSATPVATYRADGTTGIIYASAYAIPVGTAAGLVAALNSVAEHSGVKVQVELGIGWGLTLAILTWVVAWLAAGRVPLVILTQLIVGRWKRDHVRFAYFLEDAASRQVLRQAGAVYQFRHAALQTHLVRKYVHTDSKSRPRGRYPLGRIPMASSVPLTEVERLRSGTVSLMLGEPA